MEKNMDDFTKNYLASALWSSTDENGEPLDANFDIADINKESLSLVLEDCKVFQEVNKELLDLAYNCSGYEASVAGHDFWLTRNGHGAGFWDRGLGSVGEKLSEISRLSGGCDIEVGDNGELYFTGAGSLKKKNKPN